MYRCNYCIIAYLELEYPIKYPICLSSSQLLGLTRKPYTSIFVGKTGWESAHRPHKHKAHDITQVT